MAKYFDKDCPACHQQLSTRNLISRALLSFYTCSKCHSRVGVYNKYQILTGAIFGAFIAVTLNAAVPSLPLILLCLATVVLSYIGLSFADFALGTGEYKIRRK